MYAVTGASGYIGSRVARELGEHGVVYELGRRAERRFALAEPADAGVLEGVDVLIHCAWDFKVRSREDIEVTNIRGTLALFDAARTAGVGRIVFVSTMSAFDGCKSNYGQAKLTIEQKANAHHPSIVIVRPGLVYDREAGGIVGAIRRVMRRLPLVPLVGGDRVLYACHSRDLSVAVHELASGPRLDKPVIAADPVPRRFREILGTMASADGRRVTFVSVPYGLAYLGLRTLEALHVPAGLRSDSLIGLMNGDPNPQFMPLKTEFRAFSESAVLSE